MPQGTLAERIRAGGFGLGGVLTKTGLGTIAAKGQKVIEIDGEEWLYAPPLQGGFRADPRRSRRLLRQSDLSAHRDQLQSGDGDGRRNGHRRAARNLAGRRHPAGSTSPLPACWSIIIIRREAPHEPGRNHPAPRRARIAARAPWSISASACPPASRAIFPDAVRHPVPVGKRHCRHGLASAGRHGGRGAHRRRRRLRHAPCRAPRPWTARCPSA